MVPLSHSPRDKRVPVAILSGSRMSNGNEDVFLVVIFFFNGLYNAHRC